MARKYKKDIKVVLPHIDPFRDIAVYGAGEEMIKALGGELADKGKQPGIVPTSNSPYFKGIKKFGKGGYKKKYAKEEIEKPTYEIELPELTIRPEELNTKPNFITSPSGRTSIQPLNVPGRYSEEQNTIDIQKRKEKLANMPLHPLAQGVVDVAGLAYYPAAVLGSGIDVYKGNYGAAAAGLVPFGRSLRTIKGLMNTAKTVGINANKIAKTTKVLNTGVVGANTYDLYDDFAKDKLEEKAYGGAIKKYGDGGKKQTVIHTDKALFDKAYKAEMDSINVRKKYNQDFTPGYKTRPLTKEEKEFWKDEKTGLYPNVAEYNPTSLGTAYFGHFKNPVVQNILQERKPNLESIATRPMDLSSMNVGEDYSMITPKSNKKESKLSRLSPYTSSTSQYKGEIVDSEGRKELTKQEYEEAVKKYGEGYFKAYGGPLNNTDTMKKSNKKGQSPRSILSPEQRMAMQFGWGGALGTVLGTGAALGLTALTGGAAAPLIPAIAGAGASIGGSIGSNIEQGIDKNKQARQPQFQQPQYQQALPQQMSFAKGGMLNKRGIPHRGTSEQMPYQTQMQSYPNLEFGNGEQMLAMGGELEDTEFAEGGIHIKPSKRGTFTAAATKHGKSVQGFASQVLANKENYSPAMVKKANFARNAAKWKHAEGGFLNEPAEGVIERRNKNRSREPQEYATFEENFKHMYAQGGRMGAMGPMDVGKIYYADGGEEKEGPYKRKEVESTFEGPRNTFDIESTYVNDVDPNILAKQKEIAAKLALSRIMGTQGNTTLGLTGNVNYSNAQQPMGEEDSNTMLRKNPNVTGNIGVTGSYNRGNTSLTGGLGYDPISKSTTGNIGIKKQWAEGGMLNEYNGERHENGGIPIGPNAEVEGGETSMKMGMGGEQDSTYIYSDRLKVPGKNYTFAEASKKIDSKYGRRTNDKLSDESKKRELNKLMGSQEQERAGLVNSAYETIAAYGGPIRKYADGGTNWAPLIGYGTQAIGLGAEAMRLRGKNAPNKPFTMERQVLNADPQLREADISASIANRNIRDLGASTSSGGAMAGYLTAQTQRTRGKADIMSDLQNRQAQVDMSTGQYNAMAGERASDKDVADKAAQQSAYSQLFSNVGQFGANIAKDYTLGKTQKNIIKGMDSGEWTWGYDDKGNFTKIYTGTKK